jgi:CTP:molybdopterin cytidylyltransferase MocA
MGRPKLLLPFGPTTLLGHCVRQAEASTVDAVVVVTGQRDEALRRSISLGRAQWAHNPHPEEGTIESTRVGVAAAGQADFYLLLTGDAPGVTTDLIDAAASFARSNRPPGPVRTEYAGGAWGHPYLLPGSMIGALADLHGDKTLVSLLGAGLDAGDRRLPRDVNTWDDYQAVCDDFGYEPVDPAPGG